MVFLVDANSKLAAPKAVGLSSDTSPNPLNEKTPLISPCSSSYEPVDTSQQDERNSVALRAHLVRAMKQLAHRHVPIQMRLTFGVLILHKYQWPIQSDKQPIENFIRSLQLPGTTASLYML